VEKGADVGKLFGCCTSVPLPSFRLKFLRLKELKLMIRMAITPFITAATGETLDHDALYKIKVMDKGYKSHLMELPQSDNDIIDLFTVPATSGGFAFSLSWSEEGLKRYLYPKDFPVYAENNYNATGSGNKPVNLSLADCLDLFNKEETLQASEAWYCPACKAHKTATKKMELFRLPSTLIIHLKRFTYNRNWREKIDSFVDFPITSLDLAPWCPNETKKGPDSTLYDLYAVSNHFGGLGGGHYTAYAKNLIDKKWYNLDDSSVSLIPNPENGIRTRAAYVLFYQRRGTERTKIAAKPDS
jgi:hypothetical protein